MTVFKQDDWREDNSEFEPMPVRRRRLRVCLAASGGGHIRQLLDLEKTWANHEYFFVSEDTALSRSLIQRFPVHFLCHFALGQARRDGLTQTILAGLRNFWGAARIIFLKRPDIVISTGAGTVFFLILWAKLFGAKFILIESFARFDKPSVFACMAAPFANHVVVQSAALAKAFPNASVFDPLEILNNPRPAKKNLLFATVGVTFPFDRMIEMVANLKASGEISEDVVYQTGIGGLAPAGVKTFETLSFDRVNSYLREADIVVCHGGTGSVITALREGCRTIVVPRVFEKGEHYDNHQSEITNAFAARGLVIPANSPEELTSALRSARLIQPILATTNPTGLIDHLDVILSQYADRPELRADQLS
jgi:UDP-N-acetylglucosamine--N-acetylmuramyl-(pentapeptide) pyrophosphoryl-undecaprenol N-acetylglucosamine transferase